MTSLSCSVAWLDLQADPQTVVIEIGSWYQPCQDRRQKKKRNYRKKGGEREGKGREENIKK
jgi:hypothetical protein